MREALCSATCRAARGRLAGCGAATAVICGFALVILAMASGDISSIRFAGSALALLFPAVLVFVVTGVLTGIPAAVIIWSSEKFRIRSIVFFGSAGAVIGGVSQILLQRVFTSGRIDMKPSLVFAMAGLAAGLTYWLVSGKHAGRER